MSKLFVISHHYFSCYSIAIDISLFTYGVPGPDSILTVSDVERPGVQTLLVSQLTGSLYGLAELAR